MHHMTTKWTSRRTRRAVAAAGLVAAWIAPAAVIAQTPSLGYKYPTNDIPLTLRSGTVVHQRNLVVFRGRTVSVLTIKIQTPTPAANASRVAREAQEVATLHDAVARAQGISRIAVDVCRSQACVELRGTAAKTFQFVRGRDGTWRVDRAHAP
ncbi:MAG TPA: hypothetical protein VGM67_06840 [Gemmatimonadaceae bacterium]|jgi:hypothetical protein